MYMRLPRHLTAYHTCHSFVNSLSCSRCARLSFTYMCIDFEDVSCSETLVRSSCCAALLSALLLLYICRRALALEQNASCKAAVYVSLGVQAALDELQRGFTVVQQGAFSDLEDLLDASHKLVEDSVGSRTRSQQGSPAVTRDSLFQASDHNFTFY